MEPLRLGSVLCLGDFVKGILRSFHTGLKVAIAVTPRSLVYLLCFQVYFSCSFHAENSAVSSCQGVYCFSFLTPVLSRFGEILSRWFFWQVVESSWHFVTLVAQTYSVVCTRVKCWLETLARPREWSREAQRAVWVMKRLNLGWPNISQITRDIVNVLHQLLCLSGPPAHDQRDVRGQSLDEIEHENTSPNKYKDLKEIIGASSLKEFVQFQFQKPKIGSHFPPDGDLSPNGKAQIWERPDSLVSRDCF